MQEPTRPGSWEAEANGIVRANKFHQTCRKQHPFQAMLKRCLRTAPPTTRFGFTLELIHASTYLTVSSSGCMVPATCWHTAPLALNTFSITASKVWCLPSLLSSYETCIVPCS
jgi:hypothetical protein